MEQPVGVVIAVEGDLVGRADELLGKLGQEAACVVGMNGPPFLSP
jgi:hypothetical protein